MKPKSIASLRIVFTGSPSSGKTSLLRHFCELGYHCLPEVSREIIQESLDNNLDITPWQNLEAFSNMVYEKRKNQFHNTKEGWNFFDRSVIDVLAYQNLDEISISEAITAEVVEYHYDLIFLAEPWMDIFENDDQRVESWEQAVKIDQALKRTYQHFGYTPIIIPNCSIEKRAAFVIEYLEKHG